MTHCKLIQGEGDNLIWDTVLACDNRDCEYHQASHLLERAGVDAADRHAATLGALALAHAGQISVPDAAEITQSVTQTYGLDNADSVGRLLTNS